MNSHLVVIPTRRAHSNHEQVARGIGIDKRFLGDLAEIRLAVEPRAAALAAARRTEADVAELRRCIEIMRREPSDSDAFADGDLALHIAVANASGNPFMRSVDAVIE